ncbi:hypothetical protein V6N13_132424 [Hibiscus sabdariffa]
MKNVFRKVENISSEFCLVVGRDSSQILEELTVFTRGTRERNMRLRSMCWRIWNWTQKKRQLKGEETQQNVVTDVLCFLRFRSHELQQALNIQRLTE